MSLVGLTYGAHERAHFLKIFFVVGFDAAWYSNLAQTQPELTALTAQCGQQFRFEFQTRIAKRLGLEIIAESLGSTLADAREHGVPIVATPPLARTLHQLPLGAPVPPELYKVVAELIAYVWRLNGKRRS